MPWTYSYAPLFLEQYKGLPSWQRRSVYAKMRDIREGKVKGAKQGKYLRFPLPRLGDCLIAKVDEAQLLIDFQRIQLQT